MLQLGEGILNQKQPENFAFGSLWNTKLSLYLFLNDVMKYAISLLFK